MLQNDKQDLFYLNTRSTELGAGSRRPKLLRRLASFVLCTALVYYAYASYYDAAHSSVSTSHSGCRSRSGADPEEVWQTIKPGMVKELPWVTCYGDSGLLCAKLTVPLDYAHPEDGDAIIALAKLPALVPADDPKYKGPVLINPGGPGLSGVSFVNSTGPALQRVIGPEFDIVGFDPRGVARTRPQALLFPDQAEDASWHIVAAELPLWNTSADAVPRMYASAQVLGSLAESRIKQAGSYVSTALVSRDMLSITRALGHEKLQYWGFSYGTFLGATFAAMFPDKVGRLILDGVVDADDCSSSSWKKNLLDTDKVLFQFFQECSDAGPDLCALHESTPQKVHVQLTNILEKLKRRPVAVPTKNSSGSPPDYGIVEYKWAQSVIFRFLHSPYAGVSALAAALRAIKDNDGAPLWELVDAYKPQFECNCPSNRPTIQTPEAAQAIKCSDGLVVRDTIEETDKWFNEVRNQSTFADVWNFRPSCIGWKIRPVERFAGPFVANTSHPLLLIGNTLDPVTPLVNAHTMSKGFNGSVVLTQKSAGHCSFTAASLCSAKVIREYFHNGTLPKEGTECDVSSTMFEGMRSEVADLVGEDLSILNAWNEVSEAFPKFRRGFFL